MLEVKVSDKNPFHMAGLQISAYFYLFGSGMIQWRLEIQGGTVVMDEGYSLVIWNFFEDRANWSKDLIKFRGGREQIAYEKPLDITRPEIIRKSEWILQLLLQSPPEDYDREPVTEPGHFHGGADPTGRTGIFTQVGQAHENFYLRDSKLLAS